MQVHQIYILSSLLCSWERKFIVYCFGVLVVNQNTHPALRLCACFFTIKAKQT